MAAMRTVVLIMLLASVLSTALPPVSRAALPANAVEHPAVERLVGAGPPHAACLSMLA